MSRIKSGYLLAAGTILIALANLRYGVAELAWFAPVPYLLYLDRARERRVLPLLWVLAASMLAWTLAVAKIVTAPLSFLMAPMFGVPIGLLLGIGYLPYRFLKPGPGRAALFAASMVVMEWAQHSFTPLGAWGAAAYTQIGNLAFLQSASVLGPAGPSFLIYWVAGLIAELLLGYAPRREALTAAGVLLAFVTYGNLRLQTSMASERETVVVAAVNTTSTLGRLPLPPKEERLDAVREELFRRTRAAARAGAQLIVWNEASIVVLPDEDAAFRRALRELARETKARLVAGYVLPVSLAPLKYENKYLAVAPSGEVEQTYFKHEPVPGEPAVRGTEEPRLFGAEQGTVGVRLGGAICYDYDFPALARGLGKLGADIVALPSSDWMGINPLHTDMAAARAIENGHSLVRSTRMGLSAAVDPYGRSRARLNWYEPGADYVVARLPARGVWTPYRLYGDLFVYVCLSALGVAAWLQVRRSGRT